MTKSRLLYFYKGDEAEMQKFAEFSDFLSQKFPDLKIIIVDCSTLDQEGKPTHPEDSEALI